MGMRRVYLDTEFIRSNPMVPGLISVGLVDSNGSEYYAVNAFMDERTVRTHDWLSKNVWPFLPRNEENELDLDHPDVKEPSVIKKELTAFFGRRQCELYSYYGAPDVFRVHSLWNHDWGKMPEDIPRWHHELQGQIARMGNPRMPEQESKAHHALNDAWYNKQMHEYLKALMLRRFSE